MKEYAKKNLYVIHNHPDFGIAITTYPDHYTFRKKMKEIYGYQSPNPDEYNTEKEYLDELAKFITWLIDYRCDDGCVVYITDNQNAFEKSVREDVNKYFRKKGKSD